MTLESSIFSNLFYNAINGWKKSWSETVKSFAPYSVTGKVGGKYLFCAIKSNLERPSLFFIQTLMQRIDFFEIIIIQANHFQGSLQSKRGIMFRVILV